MSYPRYATYRRSGVEWLGDIPTHWRVERLKYIATLNDDVLPENTVPDQVLTYVDISSVDAIDGIITTEEVRFEDAPSRARRQVRSGDTIVSTVRTYLRAIAPIQVAHDGLTVSTGFAVVRPRSIDPTFISFALRESGFVHTIVSRSVGVSYPAVNPSELATIPLPVPPASEQRAISEFLRARTVTIDALVAKKRSLIERLNEKRLSVIAQVVARGLPPGMALAAGLEPCPKRKATGIEWLGDVPVHWEVQPIARLAITIQTGPFGSQLHEADYVEGGVPLINPVHIVEGRIVPAPQSAVEEELATRLSRHRLREGDIIMGRRGEMGRCAVITARENGWLCGTGALVIRLRDAHPDFFASVFGCPGFASLLELNAVGTTMMNLNPTIVGRMHVPVPPLHEQRTISRFIHDQTSKIDTLIATVEAAIERLQEYRAALITAAVTGKIDVRHVGAEAEEFAGAVA